MPTVNIAPLKSLLRYWIWRAIPRRPARWAPTSPASVNVILREKPFIRVASQQQRQKAFKIIRSLAFTGGLHEPERVRSATPSEIHCRYWRLDETGPRRVSDDA